MAVTITRSVWIDDDGTGQTGTVINQALHTTLYNEIDTALAKVAQLAGGNTFTGTQTITGNQTVTGNLTVNTSLAVNAAPLATVQVMLVFDSSARTSGGLLIQNSNASPTGILLNFLNSGSGANGSITQVNATTVAYNTTSDRRLKDDRGRAADLAALRAVVVHDFTWKADGRRARGVFAQEAAAVFPAAITEGADDVTDAGTLARPWMTDYSKFVPDLIVGWQQHDAALAELRALLATVVAG